MARNQSASTVFVLSRQHSVTIIARYGKHINTGWENITSKRIWNRNPEAFVSRNVQNNGVLYACNSSSAISQGPKWLCFHTVLMRTLHWGKVNCISNVCITLRAKIIQFVQSITNVNFFSGDRRSWTAFSYWYLTFVLHLLSWKKKRKTHNNKHHSPER